MITSLIVLLSAVCGLHGQVSAPAATAPHVVRAVGIGYPSIGKSPVQARLMAQRAAEVNALRNLSTALGAGRRSNLSTFQFVSRKTRPDGSIEVVVETRIGSPPPRPVQ